MPPLDQAKVTGLLEHWAAHHVAASSAVGNVAPMPGNAGLSFGFDVRINDSATLAANFPATGDRISLVIRLAPPGVRRSGNTDVLRQVPLLDALQAHGFPVATVVWSSSDESWFGTDAVIQERLDALPLHMTEPALSIEPDDADVSSYLAQATDWLAALHEIDWTRALPDWETPRSVHDELSHWSPLLERCEEPDWIEPGTRLRDALTAHAPTQPRTGLIHGDYQTNNLLFDRHGALRAVVDWELAGIGPQMLDLGWFAMFCDPDSWAEPYLSQMRVREVPQALRERYEQASGRDVDDFAWYHAFACFRFGAIATYNIRLHRTGKRPDAAWEDKVTSVPHLFQRGYELISDRR